MTLFGQEHVDRYLATDGEEGHDWQGTQTLILTTMGRRSGRQRQHPLIYGRHGDDYLVWDAGNPVGAAATAPKTSLVDLLAQLHVTPSQIKYIGISHYHGDHVGQVSSFPQSTLLIGKGDWDAVNAPKPAPGVNAAAFAN